jgi:hypothetical protein
MPNHIPGHDYAFTNLVAAYHADPQNEEDPHYLLYRGDEILALCLRQKFNPQPDEVWVGDQPAIAEWGRKLAALKDTKALPLYYSLPGRTLYTFKGHYSITGDTDDPTELTKRKGPVPLSRIVFISPIQTPADPTRK